MTRAKISVFVSAVAVLVASAEARAGNTLSVDQNLTNDASIVSSNGQYKAILQKSDGNFVIYDRSGKALWATNVYGGSGWKLAMQSDGNLVVYDGSNKAKWSTDSYEITPTRQYFLKIEDNGELNVYRGRVSSPEGVLWNSRLGRRYKIANDEDIPRAFQPNFRFSKDTRCFALTFTEGASDESIGDSGYTTYCRKSFDPNFVVFAHVTRPTDGTVANTDGNSFRVTYGLAFGWQDGTLTGTTQQIASDFADVGAHGEDAQYLVVDVVNGRVTSAWADMHKGGCARARGLLTMNGEHVVAWVGAYYHPLKLTTTTSSTCKSEAEGYYGLSDNVSSAGLRFTCAGTCGSARTCQPWDTFLNWGDPGGEHDSGNGILVAVEAICGVRGYTIPWALVKANSAAMGSYIGCSGIKPWKNTYEGKPSYTGAYSLHGCDEGNTKGGHICYASSWGDGASWITSSVTSNTYLEGATAGDVSVHFKPGDAFSDLSIATVPPASITIRTGNRVDAVSTTWWMNDMGLRGTQTHGGTGGSPQTFSGDLRADPVVQVRLCSATHDKKRRTGYLQLTTRSGKSIQGGKGSDDCQTIAPANKILYGFYGRSGDELDLLGTIWGDPPSGGSSNPSPPLRQGR